MVDRSAREPGGAPIDAVQQVLLSGKLGGAGMVAIELASMVKARGVSSHAWVPGESPASQALTDAGVPWATYPIDALRRGGLMQLSTLVSMGWRLRRGARSIVHVHDPLLFGLLSPMLRFMRGASIAHFQIDPTRDEILWALRHPPTAVVACSRDIASRVRAVMNETGRQTEVVAIANAIDVDRFSPADRRAAKQRVGAPDDRHLIVMLANLSEHKGQLTAVRALKHLLDRGVPADLWLAGEERSEPRRFTERLQTLIRELGVGAHTRLLGFRRDGADLLQASDVMLLPSTHEGLPLSILEAQAAGAVVIASPLPGIREIIDDGVTGFLIAPEDDALYADRIAALIASPEHYQRMATAARAHVEAAHTWTRYIDDTWRLYTTLASKLN